jgi:ribA/ribD-fused uncharacterized protein
MVGDKEYISLANYFHAQKFLGTDADFAEEIRVQKNPALTRAKASSKDHVASPDWEGVKANVMRAGMLAKFQANSALRRKLLATGDAPIESTIEEEMRVVGFWSIGADGAGANTSGKLLMSVRDELRAAGGDDDSDEDEAPAAKPAPKKAAAPAKKPVAAPAPVKKAAPPADADSDSDDSEDEEEAPAAKKPVKMVAKAAPAPAPAKPAAAAAADDSDDEEDEEDDE